MSPTTNFITALMPLQVKHCVKGDTSRFQLLTLQQNTFGQKHNPNISKSDGSKAALG